MDVRRAFLLVTLKVMQVLNVIHSGVNFLFMGLDRGEGKVTNEGFLIFLKVHNLQDFGAFLI